MAEPREQQVTKEPPGISAVREALEVRAVGVPVEKEEGKNRKLTGGEVLFDRVVYTGIGFGVNEVSSLWITDQFMHGKPKSWLGGKPFSKEGFEAASGWLAKSLKVSHAKAANGLLMATLLSGGTLLVLPMRYLEENKIGLVKKANHFLDWVKGSKMTPEEVQARDDDAEKAIACSPQQTWSALLVGRAAAMGTSFLTGNFIIGKSGNDRIMDFSEKHITTAAKTLGYKNAEKNDTFKRYARLTGIETYSCALSSVVLEVASKLFAKRGTEVHDPEICEKHRQKEAAPAAPVDTGGSENTDSRRRADHFRKAPAVSALALAPTSGSYAEKIQSEKENPATLAV